MDEAFSRLPRHEQRRLMALSGADVESLARRRLAGEPLQYLEGTAPFTDFDVAVDETVLIPRPETEGLYELAVSWVDSPEVVVDLGTGSGALAIALARRFPRADVHAVDLSPSALEVAAGNAARVGVEIDFHEGDLFDALPPRLEGGVALVVSNPPYVAESEWADLPRDVKREPREALVAGPRGTEVLERIADQVGDWLKPDGIVACEMGETQGRVVKEAFSAVGEAEIHPDLSGRPRYVTARRTSDDG